MWNRDKKIEQTNRHVISYTSDIIGRMPTACKNYPHSFFSTESAIPKGMAHINLNEIIPKKITSFSYKITSQAHHSVYRLACQE